MTSASALVDPDTAADAVATARAEGVAALASLAEATGAEGGGSVAEALADAAADADPEEP